MKTIKRWGRSARALVSVTEHVTGACCALLQLQAIPFSRPWLLTTASRNSNSNNQDKSSTRFYNKTMTHSSMIPKKNFSRRLDLVLTFKCFTYFHLFPHSTRFWKWKWLVIHAKSSRCTRPDSPESRRPQTAGSLPTERCQTKDESVDSWILFFVNYHIIYIHIYRYFLDDDLI